jgi:phosphoglucosamine mutase
LVKLFGTAGIRGKYLEKISPELIYRLGLALAVYVGAKGDITVAYDVRTTSPLLAQLAAAGVMAGGVNAIMLGLAPTPVLAYSIPHTKSRAGIMITASHNPPEYNGAKVFNANGMEFTSDMEKDLEFLILRKDVLSLHASWKSVGRFVENSEVVEEYIDDLINHIEAVTSNREREIKISIDCANGAASNITPRVLRKLGSKVISVNCYPDGTFPGRIPEPRPDTLSIYVDTLKHLGVEALLAHDGDADRLALVIPGKGFVKQDLLIALFAKEKLKDRKGTVIVSVDVGKEVKEVVEDLGGKIVYARLGKIHEKLKDTPNALLAAEPWKVIDPDWGPWVDGIYQAAWLVKISFENNKSIADLIEELPFYPSARISFQLIDEASKNKLYNLVKERLIPSLTEKATRVIDIDGLRVEYNDDSWILLRPSGTEPKLRVYMQAPTRNRLKSLLNYVEKQILRLGEEFNVKILNVEKQINVERTTR